MVVIFRSFPLLSHAQEVSGDRLVLFVIPDNSKECQCINFIATLLTNIDSPSDRGSQTPAPAAPHCAQCPAGPGRTAGGSF